MLLNQAEEDLAVVVDSEARIMLLYSTMEEAKHIMRSAEKLSLTGKNYVWIVTQSVVGPSEVAPGEFPVGMLGKFGGPPLAWRLRGVVLVPPKVSRRGGQPTPEPKFVPLCAAYPGRASGYKVGVRGQPHFTLSLHFQTFELSHLSKPFIFFFSNFSGLCPLPGTPRHLT